MKTIGKTNSFSNIAICLTIVVLFAMIIWQQRTTEGQVAAQEYKTINYLPSGTFLKGIALGYDEAFADFLWVKTVGYFGAHVETDRDFTWLIHMLRLITFLDSRYESPYEFAGVILPTELGLVDEGIDFLEKGIRNIPQHNRRYWLQPFYLGYCYMIHKQDALKAAHYMEMASQYPQSPEYLPLLVTRLYATANQPELGIDVIDGFLKANRLDSLENKYIRRSIKRRINELLVAHHIRMIENAIDDYTHRYGKKPDRLKDLVDGLILPFIPQEPFGGSYFLSHGLNKVFSTRENDDLILSADAKKKELKIILTDPSKK